MVEGHNCQRIYQKKKKKNDKAMNVIVVMVSGNLLQAYYIVFLKIE